MSMLWAVWGYLLEAGRTGQAAGSHPRNPPGGARKADQRLLYLSCQRARTMRRSKWTLGRSKWSTWEHGTLGFCIYSLF